MLAIASRTVMQARATAQILSSTPPEPPARRRGRATIFFLALFALLLTSAASFRAQAQANWDGEWETSWTHGAARMVLKQEGSRVTGTYPLFLGIITGEAAGQVLTGTWEEDGKRGPFEIRLSPDGKSFLGRRGDNDWWSGTRGGATAMPLESALQTPRAALRRFLNAGTIARDYDADQWSIAADTLAYSLADNNLHRLEKLTRAKTFFELLDLLTVRFDLLDTALDADRQEYTVALPLAHDRGDLRLRFQRNAIGQWRILMPSSAELVAERQRALAALQRDSAPPPPFARLLSPRDSLRAFLYGISHWDDGGKTLALQSMDLSLFQEVTRASHGEMAAHYLRRVLDKIGIEALQAIPNSGQGDEPVILFSHPVGRVLISPTTVENETKWRFDAETIRAITKLYRLTENLPQPLTTLPGHIPPGAHFTLRRFVADHAPGLLMTVGNTELWSVLSGLSLLCISIIVASFLARFFSRLLFYPIADEVTPAPWFRRCLTACIGFLLVSPFPVIIGVQPEARHVTIPLFGTVLVLCVTSIVWFVLSAYGRHYQTLVNKTIGSGDDIAVSLIFAALRAATLAGCGLGIAHFLSISTVNILAGLGIGGLAVAFAARETIANVFGAAVLVTDRPFRRGDMISIGDITGAVEHVGIRSTRLKTPSGSVVVVPNAKLADTSINNFGDALEKPPLLVFTITQGASEDNLRQLLQAGRQCLADFADPLDDMKGMQLASGSSETAEMAVNFAALSAPLPQRDALRERLILTLLEKGRQLGVSLSWREKESG